MEVAFSIIILSLGTPHEAIDLEKAASRIPEDLLMNKKPYGFLLVGIFWFGLFWPSNVSATQITFDIVNLSIFLNDSQIDIADIESYSYEFFPPSIHPTLSSSDGEFTERGVTIERATTSFNPQSTTILNGHPDLGIQLLNSNYIEKGFSESSLFSESISSFEGVFVATGKSLLLNPVLRTSFSPFGSGSNFKDSIGLSLFGPGCRSFSDGNGIGCSTIPGDQYILSASLDQFLRVSSNSNPFSEASVTSSLNVVITPEPSSFLLFGSGLLVLGSIVCGGVLIGESEGSRL